MSIKHLKGLIGESEEIRKGNLSGKKKKMAKKMKAKSFADDWFKKGMGQSAHNNLPPGYREE